MESTISLHTAGLVPGLHKKRRQGPARLRWEMCVKALERAWRRKHVSSIFHAIITALQYNFLHQLRRKLLTFSEKRLDRFFCFFANWVTGSKLDSWHAHRSLRFLRRSWLPSLQFLRYQRALQGRRRSREVNYSHNPFYELFSVFLVAQSFFPFLSTKRSFHLTFTAFY